MSFAHSDVPCLTTLQYPKQLYRYSLDLHDASLYSVQYSSTSLVLPYSPWCVLVINRKSVDRFDLRSGRPIETLPDAPFPLANAVVVPVPDGLIAMWTNSRAFRLNFLTREWQQLKSDVEKLPSLYCLVDSCKVLMLYAHTIWLTNRTAFFTEGAMEGRLFDVNKGESTSFALQLDLIGHFGCVEVSPGQVLLFGGYEEMRFHGSCLLDGNTDFYLLDTGTFQVKKVGSLSQRLEEPNLAQRAVVYNGFVHCLSGRELLRIDLQTFRSTTLKVATLHTRNVLVLLWVYEKVKKAGKARLALVPACLCNLRQMVAVLLLALTLVAADVPPPPGTYLPNTKPKYGPADVQPDTEAEDETIRLMKEWDQHMTDFVPADLVTFEVPARGHEEFFEIIDDLPSKVRGAFFVSSSETKDVDLVIYDPMKQVAYEARKKKEDLFHFEAEKRGQYVFMFTNAKFVEKVQITFALHTGNSTDEVLERDHITPMEATLLEVQKSVKDFQMDQQFAQLRQESHSKTVAGANRNVFWFSLLECVGVAGVTSWQVYYVKRILDHRRLI